MHTSLHMKYGIYYGPICCLGYQKTLQNPFVYITYVKESLFELPVNYEKKHQKKTPRILLRIKNDKFKNIFNLTSIDKICHTSFYSLKRFSKIILKGHIDTMTSTSLKFSMPQIYRWLSSISTLHLDNKQRKFVIAAHYLLSERQPWTLHRWKTWPKPKFTHHS